MKSFLPVFIAILLSAAPAVAQHEGAKDAVSVRALFFNYDYQFDNEFESSDWTNGLELAYTRHLGKAFNLEIPVRIGTADYPFNDNGDAEQGSYLGMDAELQFKHWRPNNFINPYLTAGLGFNYEDQSSLNFSAPLGGGLDFRLGNGVYLTSKAQYRIGFEDRRDNLQASAGLKFLLGEKGQEEMTMAPETMDRDGDGVPDAQDLCPDAPGSMAASGCPDSDGDGFSDRDDQCPTAAGPLNGCPDADNDGVADKDDRCPTEMGVPENNGCPAVRDADGDGIPDDQDGCPTEEGTRATNGCPDGDGDGVADREDRCPNTPGLMTANGCPDADRDGLIDSDDRCPNEAGPASNNGCPEISKEDQEILDFAVQNVNFETNSSRLTSTSRTVLDQVVDILRRYPSYSMRIGGHTDSIGSRDVNQRISEERAKSCYDYLVQAGIQSNRLSYQGYGEAQPIADNRYEAGREQNRRVEFDIYLPGN